MCLTTDSVTRYITPDWNYLPSLGAWFSLLSLPTKALDIPRSLTSGCAIVCWFSRGWTDQPSVTRSKPHVKRLGVVSSLQAHAQTIRAWPCRDDLKYYVIVMKYYCRVDDFVLVFVSSNSTMPSADSVFQKRSLVSMDLCFFYKKRPLYGLWASFLMKWMEVAPSS